MPNYLNLAHHARFIGLDERLMHIAELIAEFDPDLYIVKLEPGHPYYVPPTIYALVHQPPLKEQYIVKTMMYEQVDERLVADLVQKAMSFKGTPLDDWEAYEKALEISRLKKSQEKREERADLLGGLLNTDGNFAKHNGVHLDARLRGL